MKKHNSSVPARTPTTAGTTEAPVSYHAVVGLDVGDRRSHYCVLDLRGDVVTEGDVKTTSASVAVLFEGKGRMRIALEAGTHSPWISRLLTGWGHDVLVANARKVRLIADSDGKHDRADAQLLARLAHVGHLRSRCSPGLAPRAARRSRANLRGTSPVEPARVVSSRGSYLPA